MDSLDPTETRLQLELEALTREAVSGHYNDTQWTEGLQRRLCDVGRELGYEVRCSLDGGEWLYDVLWLDRVNGLIRDIPLVLESEWKQKAATYDFDKLLVAQGRHKAMVF